MNNLDLDKELVKAALKELLTEDPTLIKKALHELLSDNQKRQSNRPTKSSVFYRKDFVIKS